MSVRPWRVATQPRLKLSATWIYVAGPAPTEMVRRGAVQDTTRADRCAALPVDGAVDKGLCSVRPVARNGSRFGKEMMWSPAAKLIVEGEHALISTGRRSTRSPTDPVTDVCTLVLSTCTVGPEPHARWRGVTDDVGGAGIERTSAGIPMDERPTGNVMGGGLGIPTVSGPVGTRPTCFATARKRTVRESVVIGVNETTPPARDTVTWRLPVGLLMATKVGRLALGVKPSESDPTDRIPFHRRVSEGSGSLSPAIQGNDDVSIRLSGRKRGRSRSQELADICSVWLGGVATCESKRSSEALGSGTAVPDQACRCCPRETNLRGIGSLAVVGPVKSRFGLVTGSSRLRMTGSRVGLENSANSSMGSRIAGWKETPGMLTSVMPAPSGGTSVGSSDAPS